MSLLDADWPAIAAHAAHHDIVNAAEALASWRALDEDRRIAWRASADAVRMLLDAKPAVVTAGTEHLAKQLAEEDELYATLQAEHLAAADIPKDWPRGGS